MKQINMLMDKVWEEVPVANKTNRHTAKEAAKEATKEAAPVGNKDNAFASTLQKAEKTIREEQPKNGAVVKQSGKIDNAEKPEANTINPETTTDPVKSLIAEKVETIKAILKELGIEVNEEVITDKDFLRQAIKILDHFLHPIHDNSTTKIKISVQELITVDIVKLPEQKAPAINTDMSTENSEPQEDSEITALIQGLLNELIALSLIVNADNAKNTNASPIEKEPLLLDIEQKKDESPSVEITPSLMQETDATENTVEIKKPAEEIAQTIITAQAAPKEFKQAKEINTNNTKTETKTETKEAIDNKSSTLFENNKTKVSDDAEAYEMQQNQQKEEGESNNTEYSKEKITKELQLPEKAAEPAPAITKALSELKESLSNIVNHSENHSQLTQATKVEQIEIQRNESGHNGLSRPYSDKSVIQQITTRFQMVAAQSGTEVRIQLKPEHLGTVKISLEITQDTVFAKLQVDSERVKHIVETNIAQLKDALQEQGLKMDKCEVSVNNGNDEFFKRELSEQGRRIRGRIRQNIDSSSEAGVDTENGSATDTAKQLGYSTIHFVA